MTCIPPCRGPRRRPPPRAMTSPPGWAERGLAALLLSDPALGSVPERCGPLPWRRRPPGFPGLLRTICGQQISNQAAAAIWARLRALPGALEPAGLLALDDAALCGVAGLSRPKAAHARSLAAAVLEGRLRLDFLPGMGDEEAIAHLCAVRGLGRWTAGVHLLFAEDRPDIFPAGDLALAAALAGLRGLPARPTPAALAAAAEEWRPFRSLAARLLWHYWRHATGRPGAEPEDDG
ncbi:DNA-3-methyladenine glycosylase family protein [Muricoccus pecuniae]|nr:DNA-3-methyladenine glycosylase 2 family protein [Roseomonas pecuniae]